MKTVEKVLVCRQSPNVRVGPMLKRLHIFQLARETPD